MTYIVTFYSHFGAIRFKKYCEGKGYKAQIMPVPRDLSSSCGTCVRYEGNDCPPAEDITEEIEQIVLVGEEGYECLYRAKDS